LTKNRKGYTNSYDLLVSIFIANRCSVVDKQRSHWVLRPKPKGISSTAGYGSFDILASIACLYFHLSIITFVVEDRTDNTKRF
jgi:hypothetical protein